MTDHPAPQAPVSPESSQTAEHRFAQYVRILGRGKLGSRSLDFNEARDAFGLILDGEALDIQLGAFLMLLRVKSESVEELAGFVTAVRDRLQVPTIAVDLDWSSYAGKRRHYPWYLLAALTLAQHGVRVVMHGAQGRMANRLYTEAALSHLGIMPCLELTQLDVQLQQKSFAYVPLQTLSPRLVELLNLRDVLGLRSPVHTLVRLINPFNAPATLQAIFHPAYRPIHQQAAKRLGYLNSTVIKGEGGEFERNPDARTLMLSLREGVEYEVEWPILSETRSAAEEAFDLSEWLAVWRGEKSHHYGTQAIIGTLAIVKLINY